MFILATNLFRSRAAGRGDSYKIVRTGWDWSDRYSLIVIVRSGVDLNSRYFLILEINNKFVF